MKDQIINMFKQWKGSKNESIRLIAFGSSNTELGWHSDGGFNWFSWLATTIRYHLGKHIACINQGIGGEKVTDLMIRLERDVLSFSPHAAIITIGGNDANQGLPLEEYDEKLREVIKTCQENTIQPILQTYYCPLYHIMGKAMQNFPKYVECNRSLSKEFNIPLIDNYRCFEPFYQENRKRYKKIMRDPLHLNPIGNAIMGIMACRSLGLPDPKIPQHMREAKLIFKLMGKYSELPNRSKIKL